MSSPDENTPKIDKKRGRHRLEEPRTAGRKALEEALSESGKALEDLTAGPDRPTP